MDEKKLKHQITSIGEEKNKNQMVVRKNLATAKTFKMERDSSENKLGEL